MEPTENKIDKTIYQRLYNFQSELPLITKSANNPFYKSKYATLDAIQLTIQPLLKKHGLFYIQNINEDGLYTTIYTIDGEKIESGRYPLTLGDAQKTGSAITYAKRYALVAFLGIIVGDEDDDGNEASKPQKIELLTQEQKILRHINNSKNIDDLNKVFKYLNNKKVKKAFDLKKEELQNE